MDDVIFAGTAHKPPLGRAEVSLTIDNSDGMLPSAASEVRITRTLFRNGESAYGLNGTPCRLLDILELLSDTGVGRQQHMIVSQSQIDAVLNARPTDRRVVVEEAAGILKYRRRRERAERRLLATDGDLTRMSDLLREVRRRLRPLQKQAEAARRHAGLLAELEVLRVHLAGCELSDLRERLRAHRDVSEALATRRAGLRTEPDAPSVRVAADDVAQGAGHEILSDASYVQPAHVGGGEARGGQGVGLGRDERPERQEEHVGDGVLEPAGDEGRDGQGHCQKLVGDRAPRGGHPHGQAHQHVCHDAPEDGDPEREGHLSVCRGQRDAG